MLTIDEIKQLKGQARSDALEKYRDWQDYERTIAKRKYKKRECIARYYEDHEENKRKGRERYHKIKQGERK